MDEFNIIETPPADLAPRQLLEWTVKEWDTREAVIKGLQDRIGELKNTLAGLKHRQDITKDRIEKLMEKVDGKVAVPGAGTPFFRTSSDSLEIEDEAAAIAWAKQNALYLVKIVESIDRVGFKQEAEMRFRETGELIPGIRYKHGEKTLQIRRA